MCIRDRDYADGRDRRLRRVPGLLPDGQPQQLQRLPAGRLRDHVGPVPALHAHSPSAAAQLAAGRDPADAVVAGAGSAAAVEHRFVAAG